MYKNVMQQMSKGFGRPCLKTVFKAFSSYRKLDNQFLCSIQHEFETGF